MILSPAKINLFLRVLSRRNDGYHDIASLFQAVALFDRIEYSFADEDQLSCTDPHLLCDASNLILRALNLFRQKTGLKFFLKIHLVKNIPMESGLGGGSGNAATILFLCNALHGFPLNEKELSSLGSLIGSDIPFFFSTGSAYCTGRGEKVESLSNLSYEDKFWLVKPPEGLSTRSIFTNLKHEHCASIDPQSLLKHWLHGSFFCINDLEKSAFELMPQLRQLKQDLLDQGFKNVFMTGSGTALVCIGSQEPVVNGSFLCYPLACTYRKQGEWYL